MFPLAKLPPEVRVLIYEFIDHTPKTSDEAIPDFIRALEINPVLYKEALEECEKFKMTIRLYSWEATINSQEQNLAGLPRETLERIRYVKVSNTALGRCRRHSMVEKLTGLPNLSTIVLDLPEDWSCSSLGFDKLYRSRKIPKLVFTWPPETEPGKWLGFVDWMWGVSEERKMETGYGSATGIIYELCKVLDGYEYRDSTLLWRENDATKSTK